MNKSMSLRGDTVPGTVSWNRAMFVPNAPYENRHTSIGPFVL